MVVDATFKQATCSGRRAEDADRGTGWTFSPPTAEGMLGAVDRALEVRWHHPEAWQALMRNGMIADLSWNRAALEYEQVGGPSFRS